MGFCIWFLWHPYQVEDVITATLKKQRWRRGEPGRGHPTLLPKLSQSGLLHATCFRVWSVDCVNIHTPLPWLFSWHPCLGTANIFNPVVFHPVFLLLVFPYPFISHFQNCLSYIMCSYLETLVFSGLNETRIIVWFIVLAVLAGLASVM